MRTKQTENSLKGKNALVTGAAKRLGREVARGLARKGANVVIHYHSSKEEAHQLRQELLEVGVESWVVRADLSSSEELNGLLQEGVQTSGSLDILVNNASIFPPGTFSEMTWDELTRNLKINAWAPYKLSAAFSERTDKGAIVNLLDTRIRGYDWGHVPYYLSKVVLARLTRLSAVEFAPHIRVNGVAPGLILPPEGESEEYMEQMLDRIPLRRRGWPKDIVETVIFLLENTFITGEVIFVDGGRHLLEERSGS